MHDPVRGYFRTETLKMFRPQQTYVSFRPVEASNLSKGGIEMPNQPKRAQVVAVGPGKMLSNGLTKYVNVKPGDFIVLNANAFIQEIMVSGELVYYVDGDFIAGTVDEDDVVARAPEKMIVDPGEDELQVMKIVTN